MILKISQYSQENTYLESIFNKVAGEYCKIFKNSFFYRTFLLAASDNLTKDEQMQIPPGEFAPLNSLWPIPTRRILALSNSRLVKPLLLISYPVIIRPVNFTLENWTEIMNSQKWSAFIIAFLLFAFNFFGSAHFLELSVFSSFVKIS